MNVGMRGTAALILMLAASSACDEPTGKTCTEIGCGDGLYVVLQGAPGAELAIVASTDTGDERTASCVVSPDGTCRVEFNGFVPEKVTLAVSGADQQVSVTLDPAYKEFQPNGSSCPPICKQATVEISIEAGAR